MQYACLLKFSPPTLNKVNVCLSVFVRVCPSIPLSVCLSVYLIYGLLSIDKRREEIKKRLALSVGTLPDIDDTEDETNGSGSKKVVEYEHQDHIVTVTTEIDLNLDAYSRLRTSRAHVQEEGPPKQDLR